MKNISENELDHVQGGNEDAILASDAFRGLGLTYHEFTMYATALLRRRRADAPANAAFTARAYAFPRKE